MRVLLTGGAGYIGSHVAVALLAEGHVVIVLDDFSNSARRRSAVSKGSRRVMC